MKLKRLRRLVLAAAAVALIGVLGLTGGGAGAVTQPGYDTIRLDQGGSASSYLVWIDWAPYVLPLPDGNAWVFFSAQTRTPNPQNSAEDIIGTRKLYASKYDVTTGSWQPAQALSGGEIQFGASAVVDTQGTIHLVYTDRADAEGTTFGVLVYRKSTLDGGWTDPVPVAPNDKAGHQLSPELALDGQGGLHVVWQDQRMVTDALRSGPDALASNADVFESDLAPDGSWTAPIQMNIRPDETTNASRPQLAVDGDRLVAVWSVYDATNGLDSAARVEWSQRTLADPTWSSTPGVVFNRDGAQIGGRLLDMASDPTGGVDLIYGKRTQSGDTLTNTLYLQKLGAGGGDWSQPIALASGNRGSYPKLAVGGDGTVYVVYNLGSGATVHAGAVALAPEQSRASAEVTLTAGEDGAQGIPAIATDANGRVWVVYMHEPAGGQANEIRVLRGAVISSEPAPETPVASPVASPGAEATPSA